jgi:outer membrane protein assembly factor BamD
MRRILPAAVLLVAAVAGCGSKYTTLTGNLKLGQSAEENYQHGVAELQEKNYTEAIRFFEYVKSKYPYSKYAGLADLRLADVKFQQDRFVEAAEAYAQYVQLHPTSEESDYAEYRSGLARFKAAPDEFILFPPAHEKDQREAEKAYELLGNFVRTRTGSKYLPEAKKALAQVQTRLAAREWYVAEYYFKRARWAGAAGRYATLVEKYPGSSHEAEALFKMGRSYAELAEKFRARQALQQLITKHPESPQRPEAEKLLASLR